MKKQFLLFLSIFWLSGFSQAVPPPVKKINVTQSAVFAGTANFSSATVSGLPNATTSTPGYLSALDKLGLNNAKISVVNIMDYGGNNTATADNVTAINNAMAALPATGGVVYGPFGSYLISSNINVTKTIRFVGDNAAQTIFVLTSPTAEGFTFANWNSGFENIEITGLATNTSGTRAGGETTIPVNELSNFPTSGSVSFGGTAGWVTVTYTGKSASTGAGNLTGCSGVTACGVGANVMIRTGGYAINMPPSVNYSYISNCKVYNVYDGLNFASALGYIDTVEIRNVRNNAVTVDGNNDKFINRLTTASAPVMNTVVKVNLTSSLLIQQSQILQGTIGLDLNALTGITIPSVEAINTFFDNCTIGMRITASGTGSIYRSKFTNCWFSSGTTAGVQFNTVNFDGISFSNCDFFGNGKGIAADVVGGGKWLATGCQFAGNTTAIAISASASHFPQIQNCHIAPYGAFGVNTTGINVAAGTYKGLYIQNNVVDGNTTNATLGAVTVGASDADLYRICDNTNLNPKGTVTTPTFPTTTTVVTNTTGYRVVAYTKIGATAPTVITINGVASALALINQVYPIILDPGATIAFTYTVAPTWVWVAN